MSTTSESIGSLVIDLRANVAQLRVDMDAIKSEVKKSSSEMSSQMKSDMQETRQVLALMRDDFGVGVPRELRKVIASSELARDAILGIKDALFGLAFLNVGIEAFKKITEFADSMGKANDEILKQVKSEMDLQNAIALTNKAHEERLRIIDLIGKAQDDIYKSNEQHMELELANQRAHLMGLKEELGFLQAFKVERATKAFNENVLPSMQGNTSPQQQQAALQSMINQAMKVPQEVQKAINQANDDYLKALDALAALKANHSEEERQDNKKTADEQQKALDAAMVKLGEFRTKEMDTLDPIQKVTQEWDQIRATQALIITQHDTWAVRMAAAGTLSGEIAAIHKIMAEADKQASSELQKGLTFLQSMEKIQAIPAVAGIVGSMTG